MINRNRRDQSGHAALLFALMIPLLFGVFILGTDGARALQSKARLEEASEAAALAIAGDSNSSDEEKKQLAKSYISYYFPHAQIEKIAAKTIPCEMNAHCNSSLSASQRFFEYQVSADISEPNWFSKESITTSFGSETNIAGYSSARKYQSQAVDVVLVSDFSRSMRYSVNDFEMINELPINDKNAKYVQLIKVVKDIAQVLADFNIKSKDKSYLGVVPFNRYVYENGSYYNYLICDSGWSNGCTVDLNRLNVFESVNGYSIFNTKYKSLDNIKNEMPTVDYFSLELAYFHTLKLSRTFDSYLGNNADINNFIANGGTSSYSGIIRGAKMALSGPNSRKLIILLSDGVDSDENIAQAIYDNNLCSNIIAEMNSKKVGAENIIAKMYAIGFGYKASQYPLMQQCVGQGNVYDAKNSEAIKDKILELIAEEMGRLSPSD